MHSTEDMEEMAINLEQTDFNYTMSLISGKFKIIVLYFLNNRGIIRFNEMKKLIPSISYKTLSATLKELETDELVNREEFPQIPPRVEYSLTKRGKTLIPVLDVISEWGHSNRMNLEKEEEIENE